MRLKNYKVLFEENDKKDMFWIWKLKKCKFLFERLKRQISELKEKT